MSDTQSDNQISDLIAELQWRGLLKDCTDAEGLGKHLSDPTNSPRKIYAGFDPTADSLTIGNLVPIMLLAHVKRAGHTPVVVMGGGTGLIGDPSGKSAERMMMTPELVQQNVNSQEPIFTNILGTEGTDYISLNNNEWLKDVKFINLLRNVGKHFSVNMMIQKESVKDRLNNREQGISYTEFSYMILQAYDFLVLHNHKDYGVTVQIGGSDQYGNIVAGLELIRKSMASSHNGIVTERTGTAFGLTAPLVSKADGGKFGKTETGAVWLTANRTSPYAYYQFWLNSSDEDAANWIKVFTFLDQPTVEGLIARHSENPGKRELQRTLAQETTTILHGKAAMKNAQAAGKALFSGDIASLDADTMLEVFASVPSEDFGIKGNLTGDGADLIGILKATGLASSNREAREFLNEGSVSVNGRKVALGDSIKESDLLHGKFIAIRRGKKKWFLTKWA